MRYINCETTVRNIHDYLIFTKHIKEVRSQDTWHPCSKPGEEAYKRITYESPRRDGPAREEREKIKARKINLLTSK